MVTFAASVVWFLRILEIFVPCLQSGLMASPSISAYSFQILIRKRLLKSKEMVC